MATWMIVEDERDIYDVLLLVAQVLSHTGVAFASGEDAFDWIDAAESGGLGIDPPDLALIDLRLPGDIQGEEIAARLRRSPTLCSVPIILMTGYHIPPDVEQELIARSGADKILRKPLPSPAQLDRLFRHVAQGRTSQQ